MNSVEQTNRVGETVGGKYRIIRFLASGGMGIVFEAQHLVIGRHFAIKFLHSGCTINRESLHRFQQEAAALGSIASEHLVAPIDFGIALDGSPFLVMELLVGHSLRTVLGHLPRPPIERAVDWVRQACLGMQAAHDAGIIHCDLNPRNLFLCRREDQTDWIKILDFGIAKHHDTESTATRTGTILGTPAYLSPEQARGEEPIGKSVDIYALGVVLFELLSGQRPHQGDTPHSLLHHISTQPALCLNQLCPHLPPALVAIVEKAIAPDAKERHTTAIELAHALSPYATHLPWPLLSWKNDLPQEKHISRAGILKVSSRHRTRTMLAYAVLTSCLLGLIGTLVFEMTRSPSSSKINRSPIPAHTRFYTPAPNPAAVAQIAELSKKKDPQHTAWLTEIEAVPQASWLTLGTPEEVQSMVARIMIRASAQKTLPVVVSYNRPFRDCAGYSTGGVLDTAGYKTWITGLAKGIGNQPAMLILEPDAIGIIPFHRTLEGKEEWCKPMVLDDQGKSIPAKGASPGEVYHQLNFAVETMKHEAPNTLVYLDGTHSNWLPVGESAHRLVKAGILMTRGFSLNVSNFQPTWKETHYGSWVSRCIFFANNLSKHKGQEKAYRECPPQPSPQAPRENWETIETWYRQNIDEVAHPSPIHDLVHFVIDTSRNGRGPLDPSSYGNAPYHQPKSVLSKLGEGSWCNPPSAGIGLRTSINTGHPLLDAYLWIKNIGESDGACDIASGARAWDFTKYNPWVLTGEGQNRFDPLWGMVAPAAGTWFPEQALRLAENANPPLTP